jgi:hypothetical protein
MVTIEAKIKHLFFDRKEVIDKLTKAERRVLSKQGAFLRTASRRSIRRRKKISSPGDPPNAHAKGKYATLKNILFAYEPHRHSVVVGPVKLSKSRGSKTVPEVLEFGGSTRINGKRVVITKRPFMRPAYDKEKDKLNAMWKGAVKA